jgi:flagellin
MYIQSNVSSLEAQNNLSQTEASLATNFQQLSSGYKINSAADNPADLGISSQMDSDIGAYGVATQNANDAIGMAQTADGALGQMTTMVDQLNQLAVQGSNGDMTSTDRSYLDTEFQSLKQEIGRISSSTTYNGQALLSGSANTVSFQVGISNNANNQIAVSFGGVDLTSLGLNSSDVAGATATDSQASMTACQGALATINTARAGFGAAVNRLNVTVSNIQSQSTNESSADAGIKDVDVAQATAAMAANQVLSQSGVAVLSQANQIPQLALKLLQG